MRVWQKIVLCIIIAGGVFGGARLEDRDHNPLYEYYNNVHDKLERVSIVLSVSGTKRFRNYQFKK
jgi:hypothetical protein